MVQPGEVAAVSREHVLKPFALLGDIDVVGDSGERDSACIQLSRDGM
jgi:hypothetical protein